MRLLYLLSIGLLPLAGLAQSTPAPLLTDQARLECVYRLTYRPDSTQPATRTESMRLQLGSRLSRFESMNSMFVDSTIRASIALAEAATRRGETPTINIDNPDRTRFRRVIKGVVFKQPSTGDLQAFESVGLTRYVYQEPAALFTWVITPATATIAGYTCQRATTTFGGRAWEAWFTRAVPLADGPYKFYGLPGLIVKVSDTRQHYVFELTKLRQLAPPVAIDLPAGGAKSTTKAEFTRGKTEYDRSAMTQMLASGAIRFKTPEEAEAARQKAAARAKQPTNPLELN